ncbi:MAG: type II toxin-antitoxin system VapC family toxin [Actinomycetota bacterium]|nr:type II toxin-antitoxin system VapC family toxin [Actinomycetota bacterium]
MILVDANIPMYLVGADHPNKHAAAAAIESAVAGGQRLVTAKEVVQAGYQLSARDALHIAIMRRHGLDTIMSFDRGFERYPGITRVS